MQDRGQHGWQRAPGARESPRVGASSLIRLSPENWVLSQPHPLTSSHSDYYLARRLSATLSDVIKLEVCDSATLGLSSLACSWLATWWAWTRLCLPESGGRRLQEAKEKDSTHGCRALGWPWLPGATETLYSSPSPIATVPLDCPDPHHTLHTEHSGLQSWYGQCRHFPSQGVLHAGQGRSARRPMCAHRGAPGGQRGSACVGPLTCYGPGLARPWLSNECLSNRACQTPTFFFFLFMFLKYFI